MAKRKPAAQTTPEVFAPSTNGVIVKVDPLKARFFAATTEAVQADGKAQHQWKDVVAPAARDAYSTYAALCEAQAEVENLAIVPGLDDDQRAAFTTKLPHAKTKEGQAEGQKEKRTARKAAQDKVSKYFARVCEYAFPEDFEAAQKAKRDAKKAKGGAEGEGDGEGEEGDTGSASLKTKGDVAIAALIKAHEKAVNGNPGVIKYLRKALEENAKTRDDEPGEE